MNIKRMLFLCSGILLLFIMINTQGLYAAGSSPSSDSCFVKKPTPPNELLIFEKLKRSGSLKQNATPQEIEDAIHTYLQHKLTKNQVSKAENKARIVRGVNELLKKRSLKHSKQLDYSKLIRSIDQEYLVMQDEFNLQSLKSMQNRKRNDRIVRTVKKVKLLVLLADFSDDATGKGPLHNKIEKPVGESNATLWVENFSVDHYRKMLFTQGGYDTLDKNGNPLHLDTMVDYYLEQSGNSMLVQGDVFGWFTLPHSEAYYGDDNPEGGHDNLAPGTPKDMVKDLLDIANAQNVPFEDFDIEDPYDIDKDGNTNEPDGIIDHLVIVHAGVDQSGGGGAQGDNAIWAHASSVMHPLPSDDPNVPDMMAYKYIVQGENGAIGVFCHEFGHDLGLPDEYDTKYSGNGEPVGFYSLMSGGSWMGNPLGAKPAPISPWGRIQLGKLHGGAWVQPTELNFEEIGSEGKKYILDQTTEIDGKNNQTVKINLPEHKLQLTAPHGGKLEYYSDHGKDLIDFTMRSTLLLPAAKKITLSYWTYFNIEENWDFGFIQISNDEGKTWTSLKTPLTKDSIVPNGHPNIMPHMPGYTGKSNGWINETVDLTAFKGTKVMLQFRYMTDWGTTEEGFYIDDLSITADGVTVFEDNAEAGSDKWALSGWKLFEGFEWKAHYYLLEWRAHNGTDQSQKYCYTYANYKEKKAHYFENQPGLLVWYRDTAQTDNWVGIHPGQVFLGIVDSHPEPIFDYAGQPLRTRLQLHDAAFGLRPIQAKTFYAGGVPITTPMEFSVNEYDDGHLFWYPESPSSGIKVTKYGLEFDVENTSPDFTMAEIEIEREY